jgi:hypothetical protein
MMMVTAFRPDQVLPPCFSVFPVAMNPLGKID